VICSCHRFRCSTAPHEGLPWGAWGDQPGQQGLVRIWCPQVKRVACVGLMRRFANWTREILVSAKSSKLENNCFLVM